MTAVPDCMVVEDITAVRSQAPTSAFSPVVQASSIHISPLARSCSLLATDLASHAGQENGQTISYGMQWPPSMEV